MDLETAVTHVNGFTDIHTHLLPGSDDGARDMPDAMRLIRMAWEQGTRTIILTPHYRGKYKKNWPIWNQESFDILYQMVRIVFPGMKLYLGSEVYYEADAPDKLQLGEILTMNNSRYVLLEFSPGVPRSRVIQGVSEILGCGYVPIIAHAERYEIFRTDEDLTEEVLEMGALIQLNADSVLGKHGAKVKAYCQTLLENEMAHFVATDAHDLDKRPPVLRECFLHVHKKYGAEYAARVFYHNAQAVIENKRI